MSSDEFKTMEMQLRSRNITDYTFGKVGETDLEPKKSEPKVVIVNEDEPIIEELENMSLLDRLAREGE